MMIRRIIGILCFLPVVALLAFVVISFPIAMGIGIILSGSMFLGIWLLMG